VGPRVTEGPIRNLGRLSIILRSLQDRRFSGDQRYLSRIGFIQNDREIQKAFANPGQQANRRRKLQP